LKACSAHSEAEAGRDDYRSAREWLDAVEQLAGVVTSAQLTKRAEWRRQAEPGAPSGADA
jgi:hypothetical protein